MKTKQDHEVGSKEHALSIETAIAGRNDLVHACYLYGCKKCKHIEQIYLGVGVEGPKELRDKGLYIPSPFGGPRCENCNGPTTHVFWNQDANFEPVEPPAGVRCFVIPKSGIDMRYFNSGVFCGGTIRSKEKKRSLVRPKHLSDHVRRDVEDDLLVRIRNYDRVVQAVATALGGVCCGGIDVDGAGSTRTVLVEAIEKLKANDDSCGRTSFRLTRERDALIQQFKNLGIHAESENCWCEPAVDRVDPDTGAKVLVHKEQCVH